MWQKLKILWFYLFFVLHTHMHRQELSVTVCYEKNLIFIKCTYMGFNI